MMTTFFRNCLCLLLAATSVATAFDLEDEAKERLQKIHSKLQLVCGSFLEEYPEQLMTVMYLPPDAKVLELGANIGRNSCVIASLLKNSKNLVSIEPCLESARLLLMNRNYNRLKFRIEPAAVSARPLVQRDWVSIPSEEEIPEHFRIRTISFSDLQKKHHIIFDTLVVDCEGALYYMLKDDPDILNNIQLIIMESDYRDPEHRTYVTDLFKATGLKLIYNKDDFYQVWKR